MSDDFDDFDDSADVAAYHAEDEPIPICGTCNVEMQPTAFVDGPKEITGPDGNWMANAPAGWVCENPVCPNHVTDLAPVADPVEGARFRQAVEGE